MEKIKRYSYEQYVQAQGRGYEVVDKIQLEKLETTIEEKNEHINHLQGVINNYNRQLNEADEREEQLRQEIKIINKAKGK